MQAAQPYQCSHVAFTVALQRAYNFHSRLHSRRQRSEELAARGSTRTGLVQAAIARRAEEGGADMEGAAPAEQPEGAGPAQVAKRQRRRGP